MKYGQQDISFRIISAFCFQRESSNSDANGFAHHGDNVAQSSRSDGKRFSPHCQGRAGYAVVQYAATLKTIACRQRLRGIDTTIATVENLLDIPIDYYATINFDGIEDLVDAVGGVEIDVLIPISGKATGNVELEPGVQVLNGKEALAYARMRKQDPAGDIGRAGRQQQVIEAIINEATTINSFTKLNRIMNAVGENIRTNMTLSEASQLQPYAKSLKSFNRETLEGTDLTLNGVYYYEIDPADLRDAQALLQTELGMPVTADEPSTDETDDSMTETITY